MLGGFCTSTTPEEPLPTIATSSENMRESAARGARRRYRGFGERGSFQGGGMPRMEICGLLVMWRGGAESA